MRPDSSSLTWRPLTRHDAKASADLLNAMEAVDRLDENYDEQDTLQELLDPYLDLDRASLGAFDGDLLIGFMKTAWKPGADEVHRIVLDGGVHPDYRRRGVGTALVQAGVASAKELHAQHHPTLRLAVDVQNAEHVAGTAELMRSQGFEPVFYYQHMQHLLGDAIPDTPFPAGFVVEGWSEQNDDEFRIVRNESFRDHWGLVPMPVDNWRNRMIDHTFQAATSFLARDANSAAPAGMVLTKYWVADTAATGLRDAYVILLGTLRDYRRRGVAGGLLGRAVRAAADQGYDRVMVSVDSASESGEFGIYDRAGFVPTRRDVRWSFEVPRADVAGQLTR